MPSFGDDTLSACMQTEIKNVNIINNESDMDKYFKNNTFVSEITNKSNDIDKITLSKKSVISSTNKNTNSKYKKLETNNVKSKHITDTSTLIKSKRKTVNSSRKNYNLPEIQKENVNIHIDDTENNIFPNGSTIPQQCNKSELTTVYVDNKNNVTHGIISDTTHIKSPNNSATLSNVEKSSEINPSISVIPTQDRCKLASWGLPSNILRVI